MCPYMSSVYNREGVYGICTTVNIFYLKKIIILSEFVLYRNQLSKEIIACMQFNQIFIFLHEIMFTYVSSRVLNDSMPRERYVSVG